MAINMNYIVTFPTDRAPNYMIDRRSPRMLGDWTDCGNGHFVLGTDVSGTLMKAASGSGLVVSRCVRTCKPQHKTVGCTFSRYYDGTYCVEVVIQTITGTIRNTLWNITRNDIDKVKKFISESINYAYTWYNCSAELIDMIDKISYVC